MARPLPKTSDQWLKEILLAWKDARETKPFAHLTGTTLTDGDLYAYFLAEEKDEGNRR